MSDRGSLLPRGDAYPEVAPSAWIAPGAYVIGNVHLGEQSSVWYGAVLRGDTEPIRVGARTNLQDGCILHADPGYPAIVGNDCVVGHRAVVHGCLIGMGATILNVAKIGEGSIVAAGALVPEGKEYPPRSLIVGIPARAAKEVSDEQTQDIARGVREYVERATAHRESLEHSQ